MDNIINIDNKIHIIRGIQVMIDKDLAELYQVETKRLMEQVKRNIDRFDDDFMFQLTTKEANDLKSHFATSNWGGTRKLPFAFTEQGVYMLATVLNGDIAITTSKQIMRTFVKVKSQNIPYFDIIKRLESLESDNKDTKDILSKVISAISDMQELQNEAKENTKQIGFITK